MTNEDAARQRVAPRPIFHIGFDRTAVGLITDLIANNGLGAARKGGDVARDLAYSKAVGRHPLEKFKGVLWYPDLESTDFVYRPQIYAQKDFRYLKATFPGALFVLTSGNQDTVLSDRWNHRNGMLREASVFHLGVTRDELLEHWRRDFYSHIQACQQYFANSQRFFDWDPNNTAFSAVIQFLNRVGNHNLVIPPDYEKTAKTSRVVPSISVRTDSRTSTALSSQTQFESDTFSAEVASFATRNNSRVERKMSLDQVSHCYAHWSGGLEVVNRKGRRLACVVDLENELWPFLFNTPKNVKHGRTEGVLNELYRIGCRGDVAVDMQDARRFGTPQTGALAWPVFTYSRRQHASNLILWPLPGYHTPGALNYPGITTTDHMRSFESKRDVLIWRGNLTGRALPELGAAGSGNEPASQLMMALGQTDDSERVLEKLMTVPRFRVATEMAGHAGADVGLVLESSLSQQLLLKHVQPLLRTRLSYEQLYQYRYILSLSGNDTGSNFLKSVDSYSVVLKEEDGWEVFYSGAFRPWEHYIPLQLGCIDLQEKLDWARHHHKECIDMAARARRQVRYLTNSPNRSNYLRQILSEYRARSERNCGTRFDSNLS